MPDSSYSTFEDRFRGSREQISRRLSIYLPLLEKVAVQHSGAPVLDIGCGRGEWLQILAQHGYATHGVDLDEAFVVTCQQQGLDVVLEEATQHLRHQPAEAYAAVTAFHVVEHMPFEELVSLLAEIHRVLRPCGVMILETPNPENVTVSTCTFHLDHTHVVPIPPALLQYLTEQAGFTGPSVARVNADSVVGPLSYVPREEPLSLQINAAIHLLNQ